MRGAEVRAIMQEGLTPFWRRLVPFAPLFISCVLAVPNSPIRLYAALYALFAAFQAASSVISRNAKFIGQRRRQEDMWDALQAFMTVLALIARVHDSQERADLHKRLNGIALATVQRAGVRRHRAGAGPLRAAFYLLITADANGPVPRLQRYQWRGYLNNEEPEDHFADGQSEYASQILDLALRAGTGPLFDGGPKDDGAYVACLTVPVRQDDVAWGVLRVESTEKGAFTDADGIYLTLVATGLAQSLTLLDDDPEALLNYTRHSGSVTRDGGSDHD
ncbi:hypothetical protein ACQP2X_14110 [Actinoplanes sp. CA-131856]